jgi:nucleotide-binding universal stress UspA family protein
MRKGDAAAEIIAVAQESDANLVVVGSRGQTGL